jgi:DNA-binding LytR/AlgR family response regulator
MFQRKLYLCYFLDQVVALVLNQRKIFIKAEGIYLLLGLAGERKLTISKTLKKVESCLNRNLFLRCHNSYIVN